MRILDEELVALGFNQDVLISDKDLSFQVYSFTADDSYISVVNEFTPELLFKKQITTINDRVMPKQYSLMELELLIKILFKL